MRVREFFAVPKGRKISDRHLRRVLVSSICSILLCMSCLVGTTWAWYVVSLEDVGNVIEIGTAPTAVVKMGENELKSPAKLAAGTYKLSLIHTGEEDDLNHKSVLYVTFSVDGTVMGYVTLDHANGYLADVDVELAKESTLSWDISWFAPGNTEVEALEGAIVVGVNDDASDDSDEQKNDDTVNTDPVEGNGGEDGEPVQNVGPEETESSEEEPKTDGATE